MLELNAVTARYGRRTALDHVTLTLTPGVTALVGPNGAGKSTLMRIATTVQRPSSGTVHLDGLPLSSRADDLRARERIGFLPQDFKADPQFSVTEHVTYQAWLRGVPRKAWDSATREAIGRVDLGSRAGDRMGRLSGGMRQRAGIAGAIVGNPDIIVLDEPTAGLDPSQRIEFRNALARLDGASILLSTHLIEDVSATAERVVVLKEGRIVHDGPTSALREQGVEREGVSRLEDAYLSTLGSSLHHA